MAPPSEDKNVNEDAGGGSSGCSHVKGNLPPKVKRMLESVMHEVMARPNVFGASIGARISITEASIVPKTEESSRSEARVVCEVTVAEGSSLPQKAVHASTPAGLINVISLGKTIKPPPTFYLFWEFYN
jgi:acyl-coenzyme A thioesterase 13